MTRFLLALCLTLMIMATVTSANAQPAGGRLGLGMQFGEPSGLSLRIYQPAGLSPDILLTWDFDDFFFVNLHGTWERSIARSPYFHFFYGPGIFIFVRERDANRRLFDGDDKTQLGISGTFGLNYYVDRFEIYLRITPRLLLIDRTDAYVGSGIGLRFYL